jgi:alkaline phosphatase D
MRGAVRLVFSILTPFLLGFSCVQEFDLGVGAFEVGPDRAILWTHVVPLDANASSVGVRLLVASDPGFTDIVRMQAASAKANHDFTVRVLVPGLEPSTQYWYRFLAPGTANDSVESAVGTFRTAPLAGDGAPVRFVISGDSNLGYTAPLGLDFHVLSAAAQEDPDFFVFFGDTIYSDSGILPGGDAFTLDEYREVHRLTRADPHMQTLLAATGTLTGWDDHEVRNDYDGETVDPVQFENGAKAFFEYLPVRKTPHGAPYLIDRNVRWGKHVELFFLDGRQFRSEEKFCNPDPIPDGTETTDTLFSPYVEDEFLAVQIDPVLGPLASALLLTPSDPACVANLLSQPGRTILGSSQLEALKQALLASNATFKVIINNTPLSSLLVTPYDRWDGYVAEQQELLSFIEANLDPSRTLVLTTDFHTNLAVQRDELTEVIVGPIGQTTFAGTVADLLAQINPALLPFLPQVLALFDGVVDDANGGTEPAALERILGSAPDAFAYAVVDVFEDAGAPRLRVTVRGNPDYSLGANDPNDVVDLFTFEMP